MAHFMRAPVLPIVLALSLVAAVLPAQDVEGAKEDMQEGMALFTNGLYDKAIIVFRNVTLDSAAPAAQKAEAYFWTAKSYMALGRLDDADRNLERFLTDYPNAADYPEALYQKGRLLFMQEEYESSIQTLQGFLAKYPTSPYVANSYFWIGECLYNLGKIDEATAVYQKIVTDYPTSFKFEAAQYRLSLIDLARREVELSKLLKWSHEEFLKSIAEYQRREKTYTQAIEAYQKNLPDEKTIADLKASLAARTDDLSKLTAQLKSLQTAASQPPAAATTQAAQTPPAAATPQTAETGPTAAQLADLEKQKQAIERTIQLLAIKQQALDLKEAYLSWLETNRGNP